MIVRCPSCGMTQMAGASCKGCGKALAAPAPMPRGPCPATTGAVARAAEVATTDDDPAFSLDRYLFQQRMLTVSEKYDLQDEAGKAVL